MPEEDIVMIAATLQVGDGFYCSGCIRNMGFIVVAVLGIWVLLQYLYKEYGFYCSGCIRNMGFIIKYVSLMWVLSLI